jgi:uncharacterized protein YcfJ
MITGIGIGMVVGFLVGLLLPAGSGVGRATAGLLVAIAGALAGGLVSGSQVAIMEYTSGRSADRQRHEIEADWTQPMDVTPAPSRADDSASVATDDDEGAGNGSR